MRETRWSWAPVLVAAGLVLPMAACEKNGIGVQVCDADGVCDSAGGETYENCPSDCAAPPICNHDGICGPNETVSNCPDDCLSNCNGDGFCDPGLGETHVTCPADCPPPEPCDYDGFCDPGESIFNCPSDCSPSCDLAGMTGATHDVIVQELFIPDSSSSASDNGIDLDGDGDIDNKLGMVIQLLLSYGMEGDINDQVNGSIGAGSFVQLGRVKMSGHGDDIVAVQTLPGVPLGSPPAFDGSDQATVDPSAPTDLYLCGTWQPPMLRTTPSELFLNLPMPGIGVLPLLLSHARVETVTNPSSPYYPISDVSPSGWNNVMVGGGLTQEEIHESLLPLLAVIIQDMVNQGGSTADTFAELFDGNCVVMQDVPGCETVVAGQGECDDTQDPPIITVTELACNALLHSALAPDVDIDGDGEDDLLSVGLRVVRAVPVTLLGL